MSTEFAANWTFDKLLRLIELGLLHQLVKERDSFVSIDWRNLRSSWEIFASFNVGSIVIETTESLLVVSLFLDFQSKDII
jgi:hypothetical protein